jgi:hypothetical protein
MTFALWYAFNNGRSIYTNYHTTFSKKMSFLDIVDAMNAGEIHHSSIGITEIQKDLNSLGTKGDVINLVDDAISELRKYDNDFHYDSQRWMSVNTRLRAHTDMVMRPRKYHLNGQLCPIDTCPEKHLIGVFVVQPPQPDLTTPVRVINAFNFGVNYNDKEVIQSTMRQNTRAIAEKIRTRVSSTGNKKNTSSIV